MRTIDFREFEKKIGVSFKNKGLLKQAFTHRSFLNENPKSGLLHNERLEFLGDAVLELAVTEYLFQKFPDKPEGELTAFRAALVNTNMLSELAKEIGMNDFLLLSKGEASDTGKARQYILANTFEAVVGALYIDRGYDTAQKFIAKNLYPRLAAILTERLWQDAKSSFQEKAQEMLGITPSYKSRKETGPDHNKRFTVGVYLEDDLIAEGEGQSKQEAEQAAARIALKEKGWNKIS